jgi:hypothetical protein
MITKDDCVSILVKLGDTGLDVNPMITRLLIAPNIPLDVLQFIVKNNGVNVNEFYEVLRKKHNKNNSKLYTNIVREDVADNEIPTMLASLLTQITLFSRNLKDPGAFYREARADETARALQSYFTDNDLTAAKSLLKLLRADLLVLEYLEGRRELA